MGCCHKLGQSWVPEDGVVREADAGDVKVDQLGAVIVALSEGDWEADLPYRGGGAVSHSWEGIGGLKLIVGHLKAVERLDGQDTEPRATSMRALVTWTLLMTGEQSIGRTLAVAAHLSWSIELKVMAYLDYPSGHVASSFGRAAFTSRENCLKMCWEARA